MVWGKQRSAPSPSRLYCSSFLVSVLNFATSPNSGVKLLGGFLRSEKTIFRFISSGGASFSWFFFSSAAIARRQPLTCCECPDEPETPAVSTPLADAEDRLSGIASVIPPVDPEVVTLKHSAFLAQLLMEEVDLGESAPGGSNDHAVLSMRATDGPSGQVPGAKPSPNNMPVSWYDVRELQQVLWAKAEGIEQRTRLDHLKRTWKTSIWSEEDDEEMTLPDLETPLVYSLHYAQERQDWEDELPPETVGRIKKQDKGKSNLRTEEDFSEIVENMNLDPRLTKLIHKYQEVFGALPPPLSCKKLVHMDLKLKPEFEGSVVRRRPYPAPQDQIDVIERQIQECIDAASSRSISMGTTPAIVALVFWLLNLGPLLCAWSK